MEEAIKTLKEEILLSAMRYFADDEQLSGEEIPELVADFVIEQYKGHRHFPSSFTEERIAKDLLEHKATLTMMVVDCFSHYGSEGEVSHNEKNISRSYENAYVSQSLLNTILPYVDFFN